ncbi:alpha/beta hydrolase [Clostridium botulinum]|uniref:Alpha/beta hydrolase n=1 Tax=Clostridium botulinum C/D str. DC5 TaxID=1443128 RepID=A0A0A0IHL9_CLOBO|nr:alpha/beta hydrolase [Clostridium botulinum]KEI04047.1 alpha/beta hydrolase [Clostridium botulinum C/D str. BKT75002]KEI10136.1 alpha/beta hydrolase [Clostridium botulinum C/D str. BKT2873]KGM95931.1 alpha/beta hydrolase [Clostridium botulinum D str. CCUG 7971]KGN00084.1 alpha/beta hydrolase [Clostridium botulinum C/D str. DC5]KOC45696.1 alpha/beta hydrolase [Clostridium botulinum]
MFKYKFKISNIPAVLWGEKSEKLFVAVHGNMSNKEDTVIEILAKEAIKKGYQVLSFDLPEHGERKSDNTPCKVQFCVSDLSIIMNYAKEGWNEVSLFACSMGAYFSLLAYQNNVLRKALFLSPVVNMERIIENMMLWFNVTPERLQKEMTIETPIGQKLYWDYFCYVKQHPINTWNTDTDIMYGAKDELCEFETINYFVKKYCCALEIMDKGEHYFHTEEQLNAFNYWLQKHID